MEPPSPALAAALRDLRLATPRDLKRAAGRCRAIARDLPTFDCVWIDALLSLRRLTPFQAERLQGGDAGRLRVGPYVLTEALGRSSEPKTYLARPIDGGPSAVLKRIGARNSGDPGIRERLRLLAEAGRSVRSGHLVIPGQVLETEEGLVTVSRHVRGQDVRVRLARQASLTGDAAVEIACQLSAGLAEAHRAHLPHGQIRTANLRITEGGDAVLVDHGVVAAVSPALLIDDSAPPESYDGVAPELIGTCARPSVATDVYSLGCLLWHLLAGRPPFAFGDPLAKLAAHRTRRVPDVRDFAPDASDGLARLIAKMTDPDPERRLTDLEEVRRTLRRKARNGRAALRRTTATRPKARFPWSVAAAAVLALSGLSVSLLDRGAAATLLRTAAGVADASTPAAPGAVPSDSLSVLPPPDADGVIALGHPGPYAAADVAFQGPLVLRGRPGQPATIVVIDRPLHLWAESVVLENVSIRHQPSTATLSGPPALTLIEAQDLTIRTCRFESPILPIERREGAPAAVAWRMLDRADPTAGGVEIRDSVFRGAREAIFAGDRLRQLRLENVLSVGQRSLLSLGAGEDSTAILRNLTLRDAALVCSCREAPAPRRIKVTAEDCVIALAPGGRLASASLPLSGFRWSGTGAFVSGGVEPSGVGTRVADASPGGADADQAEGIVRAEISFAGPVDGSDAASAARVSGAPRLSGRSPGFDLSRLPRESATLGQAR